MNEVKLTKQQQINKLILQIKKDKEEHEQSMKGMIDFFIRSAINDSHKIKDLEATIEFYELNDIPKKSLVKVSSPKAKKSSKDDKKCQVKELKIG